MGQRTSLPLLHISIHLVVQWWSGQQYGTSCSFPKTTRPICLMLWPPPDPAKPTVRLGGKKKIYPRVMEIERSQGLCWWCMICLCGSSIVTRSSSVK